MTPAEVFRLEREDTNEWVPPRDAAEAIRLAVAEEREACALLVERPPAQIIVSFGLSVKWREAQEKLAAAIRARGREG